MFLFLSLLFLICFVFFGFLYLFFSDSLMTYFRVRGFYSIYLGALVGSSTERAATPLSVLVQTIYIVSGDLLMSVTLTTCSRSVVRRICYIHMRSRLTGSIAHHRSGSPTRVGSSLSGLVMQISNPQKCKPSHTHRPRGLADNPDL